MFVATKFVFFSSQKQSKCLSSRMDKLWYIHTTQNSMAMKTEQATSAHIIVNKSQKPKVGTFSVAGPVLLLDLWVVTLPGVYTF